MAGVSGLPHRQDSRLGLRCASARQLSRRGYFVREARPSGSEKFGVLLGRFQWLAYQDCRTDKILAWDYVVRPRGSYRAEDILYGKLGRAALKKSASCWGAFNGWRIRIAAQTRFSLGITLCVRAAAIAPRIF